MVGPRNVSQRLLIRRLTFALIAFGFALVACAAAPKDPLEGDVRSGVTPDDGGAPEAQAVSYPPSAEVDRGECGGFARALCNFDGTCLPLSSIVNGAARIPGAGVAGSTALVATGKGEGFAMPYWDFMTDMRTVRVDACQTVCEADLRVVDPSDGLDIVSDGAEQSWWVTVRSSKLVLRSVDGTEVGIGPLDASWFHVRLRLEPTGDGGVTNEVVIANQNGPVGLGTIPVTPIGTQMSFGTLGSFANSGTGTVYVDNVTCQVSAP